MRRSRVGSVGVLGGGTAGYFTALVLRARFPALEVTLIESSKIPIIGVGEATTPPLVTFLHSYLGIDVHEVHRAVVPTWKLGVHFDWGPPGGFDYPFSWGDLADAEAHDGSIQRASMGALMMQGMRGPVARKDDELVSLFPAVRFAYHLDNRRFVRFLKGCADRAGVRYRDAEIAEVATRPGPRGEGEIRHLKTADGEERAFDFYVDCTGFRSLLVGKTFESAFTSYASTLFCDRAIVADVPHDGRIKPYTLAETMDHGWCWNLPMRDVDHRGYVYSSAFCSEEEAAAEMRAKNPGMGAHWSVKFRSGRHAHFTRGNTAAIGNAYGFVEPLESTAIHMVIIEVTRLVKLLDADPTSPEDHDRDVLDRRIGAHWDYLRYFLGLHYRFNRRLNTPFWRACRSDVDISGLDQVVDDFRANGPLSARGVKTDPDAVFGAGGLDIMLLGQQVRGARAEPRLDAAAWQARCAEREAIVARSLPHADALRASEANPAFMDRLLADPAGWSQTLLLEML